MGIAGGAGEPLSKSACFGARVKKGRGWHRVFSFFGAEPPFVARVLAVFLSCVEVASCVGAGASPVASEKWEMNNYAQGVRSEFSIF